jgi:hypothetical protein
MGPAAAGAVDIVLGTLESGDGGLRAAAAEALGVIGVANERVLGALIKALDDDGPRDPVWVHAALALGNLGRDAAPATRALAERLPVRRMEEVVESTIREIGPAAVPELRKMASSDAVPGDLRKRVGALADDIERAAKEK